MASELKNSMIQKDLPVCVHEFLWLIKVVSTQLQWKLHSIDIKTAFLQGKTMDKEVC